MSHPVSRGPGAASLTVNQLEVFATVARAGSFTRAGEILLRSEAAISQQIKLLEATVGTRLIVRSPGRPMRLTEAGRLMLATSEMVLHQLERTLEELSALKSLYKGSVVVGAGAYFSSYLLPFICASFYKMVPGVRTRIHPTRGVACIDAVRRGYVDLAVTACDEQDSGIAREHLAGKDTVWIARPEHGLAAREQVTFEDVAAEDLVLAPSSSSTRRALDKWAAQYGAALSPTLEIIGVEAQVTAVLSGLGIAAVPAHVLSRYPDAPLRVLSVSGFPLRRSWWVAWREGELSPAATAFRDSLLSQRTKIEETSLYTPRVAATSASA